MLSQTKYNRSIFATKAFCSATREALEFFLNVSTEFAEFSDKQECIPLGCIPSTAVAISGVGLPRGCLPGVGCLPGGVCLGECLPRGCLPGGV